MAFKYASEIASFGIENCPPDSSEVTQTAYHWCHSPIDSSIDFIPPGVKKPSRLTKGEMKKRCGLLALSMYSTEEQAKIFFRMQSFSEAIIESIGEFIAEGSLECSDGQVSDLDEFGHFNFHEYEGVNLIPRFSVVSKV